MKLAGLLIIRDDPRRRWRAARRELARVGLVGMLDVIAFRAYSHLVHGPSDSRWEADAISNLRRRYPSNVDTVPRLTVSSPNSSEAKAFLQRLQPDLAVARCKMLLRPEIFEIARAGTFVLHPGICPEYRNAHGCFWALANRDLERVGMTLLRVDDGIDTGPIYLHGTCEFDERCDSHIVIQQRAVADNLESIASTLMAIVRGSDVPTADTTGRRSAVWGQPRLSAYFRWKLAARRSSPRAACTGRAPQEAQH
jgi:folate-dependent phosphoribosylglycinamide formyltransferase PurN